jgi:nucleotide sugar dehydrogenase
MKPVVGIWGVGVVGLATGVLFQKVANIYLYDKYSRNQDAPGVWIGPEGLVINCDYIFLCLPTPMKPSKDIDLSYIDSALRQIHELKSSVEARNQIIIIRSTSVSGSSDYFAQKYPLLNIAFVPEFLTEANPLQDTLKATKVIIGANDFITFIALKNLFELAYGTGVTYVHLSRKEAETYKYVCNVLLATQVMICNEIKLICDTIGVDYSNIQKHLYLDKRLGTHTQVPGPDGDVGVGGKCLVKDPYAFISLAKSKGYTPKILETAMELNEKIRKKKDWLEIPGAVSDCKFKEDI